MTEQFNQWINSGRFVYCLVLAIAYDLDEYLQQQYPDAPLMGLRKILNVDKKNAGELVSYLGDNYDFEYTDQSTTPMLLTHSQVQEVILLYFTGDS